MAGLPVIAAPDPTTLPAVPERVYDRYVLLELRVSGPDPNQPIVAIATLQKQRLLPDGSTELSPTDGPIHLRIDDVMKEAATDADLAQVMGAIVLYLNKLVKARLTPPPAPLALPAE
jgi:hypothetical protein